MRHLPPVKALAIFEAVGRHLSVTRAAEELSLTPSAVSQQLNGLETALGVSLFRRQHRQLVLTEAGARLLAPVSEAMRLMREALKRLDHTRTVHVLSVRVVPSFASNWLMPRLTSFLAANPEIDVHIDATPEPTDFTREIVDLEIRHGAGGWQGLFVEPLLRERIQPLASPDYLAPLSGADPIDRLAQATLIHSVKSIVTWNDWLAHNCLAIKGVDRGLRFDRSFMSIQAALDGLGIALESDILVEREVERGDLVPVFPDLEPLHVRAHWLVLPHGNLQRDKVMRFRRWLSEQTDNRGGRRAEALEPTR